MLKKIFSPPCGYLIFNHSDQYNMFTGGFVFKNGLTYEAYTVNGIECYQENQYSYKMLVFSMDERQTLEGEASFKDESRKILNLTVALQGHNSFFQGKEISPCLYEVKPCGLPKTIV